MDFDVCTNETFAMTDREILDHLTANEACAEKEQVKDEQLKVDDILQKQHETKKNTKKNDFRVV